MPVCLQLSPERCWRVQDRDGPPHAWPSPSENMFCRKSPLRRERECLPPRKEIQPRRRNMVTSSVSMCPRISLKIGTRRWRKGSTPDFVLKPQLLNWRRNRQFSSSVISFILPSPALPGMGKAISMAREQKYVEGLLSALFNQVKFLTIF